MHRPRLWATLLIVASLALGSVPAASAPSDSDYDRIQRDLAATRRQVAKAEARERELKRSIATIASRSRALQAEIDELSAELGSAQRQVDSAESEWAAMNQRLMAKVEELELMLERLREANDVLRRRTVQVYKTGPVSFLHFLAGATTLADMIARVHVLGSIFASDDARLRDIEQQRDRVSEEILQIEALKELAAEQLRLVQAKRNQVASLKGAIDVRKRELDVAISRESATLEDVQTSKQEYLRQQRELEEESRRIAALLRGRGDGTASATRGEMVWPTRGPVTSPYGYRTHPIHGDRRFHNGIDIGAPHGQSIVAAASGTVAFAGARGGYGNTVIVDHGGGLATVYAHQSSIAAGEGATVRQGQQIGRIGCTGSCTGPHLHFEVRVNGNTQDPMAWLS